MYTIQQIEPVTFTFPASRLSTSTQTADLTVPSGTDLVQVCLQGFDVSYTDDGDENFGKLQVSVTALSSQQAQCTVTLRDDDTNDHEWSGTVTAVAISFQGSNSSS